MRYSEFSGNITRFNNNINMDTPYTPINNAGFLINDNNIAIDIGIADNTTLYIVVASGSILNTSINIACKIINTD
jgi:hypothetical protein